MTPRKGNNASASSQPVSTQTAAMDSPRYPRMSARPPGSKKFAHTILGGIPGARQPALIVAATPSCLTPARLSKGRTQLAQQGQSPEQTTSTLPLPPLQPLALRLSTTPSQMQMESPGTQALGHASPSLARQVKLRTQPLRTVSSREAMRTTRLCSSAPRLPKLEDIPQMTATEPASKPASQVQSAPTSSSLLAKMG